MYPGSSYPGEKPGQASFYPPLSPFDMSASRLSPRQKMINMMYLVLLAILALNVSAEVLDAFVNLRRQLQLSAQEANTQAYDFVAGMQAEIDREIAHEGKRTNAGLQDTLRLIRQRTQGLLNQLDTHVREMEAVARFDPERGDFARKDETERNYRYWMGDDELAAARRGNGAAHDLRDSLDGYYAFIAQLFNGQVRSDSLRIEARRMQDPAGEREDPHKRWEQYTFEGPVMANMATLEAMKIEVLRAEKQLLDLLNTRLGVHTFTPDRVMAVSAPEALIVPAGMTFDTRLFVGMSSSQIQPVFSSSAGRLEPLDDGNAARLRIPARGDVIPPGQYEGQQTYTATIQVPKATGGYETLTLTETFTVRKPEVKITSAAVQHLYRDCANDLNIEVPLLGAAYRPRIEAQGGGRVQVSSEQAQKVRVIPSGQALTLNIASENQGQVVPLDAVRFQVITPPKPMLDFKVNGREYNGTTPVTAGSRLTVALVPDPEFARTMRQDARYRIARAKILLKNGLGPPQVVKTIDLSREDATREMPLQLSSAIGQARPGDRIFVQLEGISRLNFQGQSIPDTRFSERELTVAFELR